MNVAHAAVSPSLSLLSDRTSSTRCCLLSRELLGARATEGTPLSPQDTSPSLESEKSRNTVCRTCGRCNSAKSASPSAPAKLR